jgi:hypothetical protein
VSARPQVRAERDAVMGSERVLGLELDTCRAMLAQQEAQCAALRAENSDMVRRAAGALASESRSKAFLEASPFRASPLSCILS